MDNNLTNQNLENNEPELNTSGVNPIVPDPDPVAGMEEKKQQPDFQQPEVQQPEFQQSGFQQPGFQQPGFQQPGFQQPGFQQPMYDQNPAMNQQGFGQPVNGMAYNSFGQGMPPVVMPTNGKKPKKPMTKGKLAGIIAGCTAGVAAIVCGVIFIPKLFHSPKKVVLTAIENTLGISSDTTEVDNSKHDKFGFSETMDEYYLNGGNVDLTVSVDSIQGLGDESYKLSIETAMDPNAKLVNGDMTLSCNDNDVANVKVYGNENETHMEIPGFINGYISLPNNLDELLQSPMLQYVDIPSSVQGITFDYFSNAANSAVNGEMALNSGYINALETLWDKVDVDKKGKKTIDVNGESVKATKYVVTISQEDIEEAVQDLLDGVLESAKEQEAALAQEGLSVSDVEMLIQQLDVKSLITEDFCFDIYVKDEKVVKVEANGSISLMYININYDFFLDIDDNNLSGEVGLSIPMAQTSVKLGFDIDDIKGNTSGKFYMTQGDETKGISFDCVRTENGTAVTRSFNIYQDEDRSGVVATFDITTDSAANSFDAVLRMASDEIAVKGAVTEYAPGKSFTVIIDKIALISDGAELICLSAEYALDATTPEVHDIDSSLPVYNLATMTVEDLEMMLMENSTSIMQWTTDFTSNAGTLGQMLFELFTVTDSPDDYYESGDYYEPDEPSDFDLSFDDAIISGDNYEVKIERAFDSFVLDYISEYFVDLIDENGNYIEYEICEGMTIDELLLGLGSLDCEVSEHEENQIIEKDGIEYHYTKVVYDMGTGDQALFKLVRPIDDTTYVVMTYLSGTDAFAYTAEDLVEGLTDSYITIR